MFFTQLEKKTYVCSDKPHPTDWARILHGVLSLGP